MRIMRECDQKIKQFEKMKDKSSNRNNIQKNKK